MALMGNPRSCYAVIDGRTGKTMARWETSGYACGYHWLWEQGTLVFFEGDVLTLWKEGVAATSEVFPDCQAKMPVFSADRTRFTAMGWIWDLATRRRIAEVESNDSPRKYDDTWRSTEDASWFTNDDEKGLLGFSGDGRFFRLAMLVDPQEGATPVVFDEQCWAGPQQLPAIESLPKTMPRRNCPELAATFQAAVRAQRR